MNNDPEQPSEQPVHFQGSDIRNRRPAANRGQVPEVAPPPDGTVMDAVPDAPCGSETALTFTVPENPFAGVTVTAYEAEAPVGMNAVRSISQRED